MTTVGHTIMGVTTATVFIPFPLSRNKKFLWLATAIFAANIPDIALPGWGHDRYYFSHSIVVNAIILFLFIGLMLTLRRDYKFQKHFIAMFSLAWMSHFILDSFYNHGKGLRAFWPISDAALNMPIPIFETTDSSSNLFLTYLIEFLVYGSVLLLVYGLRRFCIKKA